MLLTITFGRCAKFFSDLEVFKTVADPLTITLSSVAGYLVHLGYQTLGQNRVRLTILILISPLQPLLIFCHCHLTLESTL